MNSEDQVKTLREELLALKSTFARKASELQIYTYSQEISVSSSSDIYTVTLYTDDHTNTIASVEINKCRRIPFEGGARWYVSFSIGLDETPPVTKTLVVRSIRKGNLEVVL